MIKAMLQIKYFYMNKQKKKFKFKFDKCDFELTNCITFD